MNEANQIMTLKTRPDCYECNGIEMDLSDSPMTSKLFDLFFHNQHEIIRKEDILTYVYKINPEDSFSERFWETYIHNVIKLVSRARILAKRTWGEQHGLAKLNWFSFDNIAGGWRLYSYKKKRSPLALGASLLAG